MKRTVAALALIPMLAMFVACENGFDENEQKPDEEIVKEYGPYEDIKAVNGKVRFYLYEKVNSTRTATNISARDWKKSQVLVNGESYDVAMSDEETPRPYIEVTKAGSYNATLVTSTSNKWYGKSTVEDIKLPHSQIYHTAISAIKSFPMYASYSKSVGNKLIFNDGFAMVVLKLRGEAKISSVKIDSPTGKDLAGHSNYSSTTGAFSVDRGMEFVALNCTNKGEFVQLSDSKLTNFRLMVAPGNYPMGLKISICDSEHGAMFITTDPITLAAGDVHAISKNYQCEEDLVFYEGFDNFVWGGDIMKGEIGVGFSPSSAAVGEDTGLTRTGYESALSEVAYNTPGSGLIQPNVWEDVNGKTVSEAHQLSESYIASRNIGEWFHLFRVQEHPGYIVSGTSSARGVVTLPNTKAMKGIGDVKVKVRFALESSFRGRLDFNALYGGVIKSAKINGKSVTFTSGNSGHNAATAILSLAIDNAFYRPSSSTSENIWNDLEVVISGATDGTRLAIQNTELGGSNLRIFIDKFEVRKLNDWKDNSNLRVILFNIQNGIIADQHNNYDNFVEWVKKYDPDICIWTESESIYKDKTGSSSGNSKYLPNNWDKVAARYGHSHVAVGGNRDNYPQTVTAKFPIQTIKAFTNTDDGGLYDAKYISHGAGHFTVDINGKKINIVTCHMWPQAYAPNRNTQASRDANEGNYFREYEMKYIVKNTVNNSKYAGEEYWLLGGDTNSRSPHDKWFYPETTPPTAYLPHEHILEKTNLKDVITDRLPKNNTYFMTTTYGSARIDILYASPKMFDKITNSIVLMDDWLDVLGPWEYYTSFRNPSDHRPVIVDFNL
ncbi:MAG: metal-dependent hydrolase [Alistipes sp.]|nr:metal-dependent hydrolase [Alistipes sp.]